MIFLSSAFYALLLFDVSAFAQEKQFFITHSPSVDIESESKRQVIAYYREISPGVYAIKAGKNWGDRKIEAEESTEEWKKSPALLDKPEPVVVTVRVLDIHQLTNKRFTGWKVRESRPASSIAVLDAVDGRSSIDELIADHNIVFIDAFVSRQEESPNTFQDLSVNRFNVVHATHPEISGQGMIVSVKERAIDTTDIDLRGRTLSSPLKDPVISLHSNQMATIIAGAGNSIPKSKGIAWQSKIVSTSYDNPLPDDFASLPVSVQNHSYGVGIQNYYGTEAKAYDAESISRDTLLHVFSSGNAGLVLNNSGTYAGIPEYATITGNMKMAKNVLVVGGHTFDYVPDVRNSSGPAYDGRIKPEVVAHGPEGTSDASAFVSGQALLIQQYLKEATGAIPPNDLVKALIVSSTDDIGQSGIDFKTGFGVINARKSFEVLDRNQYWRGSVSLASQSTKTIQIPSGTKRFQLCLVWNDPPAEAGALKALKNDLDIRIRSQQTNQTWRPWILSSYPHYDSLSKPARRGIDRLNNIEYITIDNPPSGSYDVIISGHVLVTSQQDFSVAYYLEADNFLQWTFPVASDKINASEQINLRWDTNLTGVGALSVSINDEPFVVIENEVQLSDEVYNWTPVISNAAPVRFRMQTTEQIVETATVELNPMMELNVGFLCSDSLMLTWESVEGADGYQLYELGEKFLTPTILLSDTSIVLDRTSQSYYAIAPVVGESPGYRSASYNVNTQGAKCYYNNFYAAAADVGAILAIELSTTYHVDSVIWQKLETDEFVTIAGSKVQDDTTLEFVDASLKPGLTQYRAVIKIDNGSSIISEVVTVYSVDDRSYFIYPNPLRAGEELTLLSNADDLKFEVIDSSGKVVKEEPVVNFLVRLRLNLTPGIYFYRISRSGSSLRTGRIVLY